MSSKKQHGGRRSGSGRPPMEQGRRNLVIDASPEEKAEIEAALTTRQRTEILLAAARSVPPNNRAQPDRESAANETNQASPAG